MGGQAVVEDRRVVLLSLILAAGLIVLLVGTFISHYFLLALASLLLGYAVLDRGFAYIGSPPLYVGELVLLLALAAIVIGKKQPWRLDYIFTFLVSFMLLGLARAIPFWNTHGIEVARDSVTWTYAIFAIALLLTLGHQGVDRIVRVYGHLLVPVLFIAPIIVVLSRLELADRLTWPISNGSILSYKGGDLAVHAAGAAGFMLLGLSRHSSTVRDFSVWAIWAVSLGISVTGRSAMLTIACSFALCLILMQLLPKSAESNTSGTRRLLPLTLLLGMLLALVVVITPNIQLGSRSLSVDQVEDNVRSIFSDSEDVQHGLQGTKNWRTSWWSDIIDYTFNGEYFWTGKGFGLNLANEDGFQPTEDRSLRAPHSAHFTVLARMGVPGLVLWIALQLAFVGGLTRAFFLARRRRDVRWARIDAWVLVYWTAFMVNASFDVYLEGPQGGIWFWSLFGFGWAALRLQSERPVAEVSSLLSGTGGTTRAHPARP
jgi:hypothetical protein